MFEVRDRSQVGEARRRALQWAEDHGCGKDLQSTVALVVSELAGNLSLHTRDGGCLVLRMLEDQAGGAVEIHSLDRGPGHANFGACMQDGYSTAGTAGTGLGAVRRASASFDIHSQPGLGTALRCVVAEKPAQAAARHQFGLVNVPIKGEQVCGDACSYLDLGSGRMRMLVADGLGHGPLAAEASERAVKTFELKKHLELPTLMEEIHEALRGTRGAAVAVAEINMERGRVFYAGVGNIAGCLLRENAETSHLVTMNGTMGVVRSKIQQFDYAWDSGAVLVMTSDGIKNHWRLDKYAGVMTRHSGLLAGILFRDFARQTDDMTVAVLRVGS
ncbi:MAG: SpoIIE family protein phosphatase [Prosthecobacter sp.]